MVRKVNSNLVIVSALVVLVYNVPVFSGDANLVSHWTFDDGSGTIAYDSAGENDGTLVGDPMWTSGQIDGSLSFDGSGDYVSIGNTVTHNLPNGTFAAWVYPLDMGRYCGIRNFAYVIGAAYWPGELGFRVSGDGGGFATVQNTSSHPGFYIPPGTFVEGYWYHVALTWDGSHWRGYVNGLEKGSLPSTLGTSASSPRDTLIGKGWDGCSWNGAIDDVRIYDKALTAAEVEQLYFEGLSDYERAVIRLENALDEKQIALDAVDAAMAEEADAYEALDDLLDSKDYGDLRKSDIIKARQRIHSAIQHQDQSAGALERGLEQLVDAMEALGVEAEPNEP
ncbi:MAG: LamG domain-containing protein [Planctomycetota bacterium]|nr:MAG: LamG domain-containing protein [Planctomycetota bacterium]